MKRLLLFLVLLPVLLTSPALAVVPSTMSYQGVLMDNAGALVPDGDYSLTFKLYAVASGGAAVWTETQNPVAVSRGGFSVILGSVVPLSGLAFDVQYWLGITVGAGTEMTPRVALASSPYGLALRLPFAGTVSSSDPALAISNAGAGPAITADPRLDVGTTSSNGLLRVYGNGAVGAQISSFGPYGEALILLDPSGNANTYLEPDVDGNAGWFWVRGAGSGSFVVDGNNGSGSPTVSITGAGSVSYFNTDQTGNAAVQLPTSSVSAAEILDEPGIAQGHVTGSVSAPIGTTMGDIVTVTLTTPANGYVVVEADARHVIGGNATSVSNYAVIQIDETAGGSADASHYFMSGYWLGAAGAHNYFMYSPVSIRRTYYKAAGTYTFRFEAYGYQNESLLNSLDNPTITATFYPTSYGSVTTAVTPEEASRFSNVQRTASAGQFPQEGTVEGALVDLRELELRDAQASAQAERAHRQLIEAQLAQQNAKAGAKPATTKQP